MTKVIPFKAAHVDCMDIREYENNTVAKWPNFQQALTEWENKNIAGTILADGRVIAVFGFIEMWPGVCEVFVLPSKYLHQYSIGFAKCVKRALNSGIFETYHRIQIQAMDDDLHNRWLKFLGFELEGVFKKYDAQGNDYKMWARVK